MPLRTDREGVTWLVCTSHTEHELDLHGQRFYPLTHRSTTMRRETGLSPWLYCYCCSVCSYVEHYFESQDHHLHEKK